MNITVRKVVGGFRAKFSIGGCYGKMGKSREEAIGILILGSSKKVGIDSVVWDKADDRTLRYTKGIHTPTRSPAPSVDTAKLPAVRSPAEARKLRVRDLSLPLLLSKALAQRFTKLRLETLTLGHVCNQTEEGLRKEESKRHPFGPKTLALLRTLLTHYKLKLKGD